MNISSTHVLGHGLREFNDKLNDVLRRISDANASAEVHPFHIDKNGWYQTIVIIRREVL